MDEPTIFIWVNFLNDPARGSKNSIHGAVPVQPALFFFLTGRKNCKLEAGIHWRCLP
jgi:hypothetical protein